MFVLSRVADKVNVCSEKVLGTQYLFSLQCGEYGSTGTNRKLNFKNSSEWQLKHGVMP